MADKKLTFMASDDPEAREALNNLENFTRISE